MLIRVNRTPPPPPRECHDPIPRVTVQFIGAKGESMAVCVMPRAFWESTLRPVLLTGAITNGIPHELQETA